MRICLTPKVGGGGPASFQTRLAAEWKRSGVETTFDPAARPLDGVLVFAGTRDLPALSRCRRDGIRIVQRLDGINWQQRVGFHAPGYFARAEARNLLLRCIRAFLADRVVYQSRFIEGWWERWFGRARADATFIHNGVPLEEYPPQRKSHDGSLLVVEGTLQPNSVTAAILFAALRDLVKTRVFTRMEIYGRAEPRWIKELANSPVVTTGVLPPEEVRTRQLKAAAYLSVEINPPCPNSVIEALAAGLPVLGFDTGSLRELVGTAGEIVPYAGDPWKLEVPKNLGALEFASRNLLADWAGFSTRARWRAESMFDIRRTALAYLEVLTG